MAGLVLDPADSLPWSGIVGVIKAHPKDRANMLAAAAVEAILYEPDESRAAGTLRMIADEIESTDIGL
jgi:hypothetical protein